MNLLSVSSTLVISNRNSATKRRAPQMKRRPCSPMKTLARVLRGFAGGTSVAGETMVASCDSICGSVFALSGIGNRIDALRVLTK